MATEFPYEGILILDESIEPVWMSKNTLPILSSIQEKHQQAEKVGFSFLKRLIGVAATFRTCFYKERVFNRIGSISN